MESGQEREGEGGGFGGGGFGGGGGGEGGQAPSSCGITDRGERRVLGFQKLLPPLVVPSVLRRGDPLLSWGHLLYLYIRYAK